MEAPLLHLALVGTPNSGKTSLFNALTGSRQKVANYPGVTVERKEGFVRHPAGTPGLAGRSARHLFAARPQPGRGDHPRHGARPHARRGAAGSRALRGRFHQSAADHPPRARTQGAPAGRWRWCSTCSTSPRAAASRWTCRSFPQALGVPVVTSIAVRKGGTADLLRLTDEIARARPGAGAAKSLATADRRRSCAPPSAKPTASSRATVSLPTRPDTWTARIDAVVLHPVAGLADPRADPVRDVPGGVRLGAAADGVAVVELRARSASSCTTRCPAGLLQSFLQNGVISGVGSVDRVPAADHHHLPVHPAAGRFRLHGARRVPDGPHHGRRRPARPRLHSAAVELRLRHSRHHGDAGDRQSPRPADHHPDRAADDLFGAHSRSTR